MYSADFAPALVPDTGLDVQAEQRTVDPSGEFNQTSAQQVQASRHEIVFVETATPDYEKLIADIRAQGSGRDIEVVLLDAGKDGVAQITKTLAGRDDVSAVHLVSHGADGSVQLGKTSLDFDSLLKNGAKIKSWGAALTADADILIYGCNVAQTDNGRSLVEALARLTGADVAASDDLTGNAKLGGDWDLEFHAGQIDTSIVFSQSVVLDWNATLQGVAVGGETKVNTTTTGAQDTNAFAPPRVVAVDANGNYVAVWTGEGTGDTNGVFFQRYNASGVAQGAETRVNQTVADSQDSPTVAMDASGNFVVAWRSNNQDGSGTGIYARRYNAAGTALSSEFRVNTHYRQRSRQPDYRHERQWCIRGGLGERRSGWRPRRCLRSALQRFRCCAGWTDCRQHHHHRQPVARQRGDGCGGQLRRHLLQRRCQRIGRVDAPLQRGGRCSERRGAGKHHHQR